MKTKDENKEAKEKTENKLKEGEEKTDQIQLEAPEGKTILTLLEPKIPCNIFEKLGKEIWMT